VILTEHAHNAPPTWDVEQAVKVTCLKSSSAQMEKGGFRRTRTHQGIDIVITNQVENGVADVVFCSDRGAHCAMNVAAAYLCAISCARISF